MSLLVPERGGGAKVLEEAGECCRGRGMRLAQCPHVNNRCCCRCRLVLPAPSLLQPQPPPVRIVPLRSQRVVIRAKSGVSERAHLRA